MVIDSGGGNVVDVDPSKNLLKIYTSHVPLNVLYTLYHFGVTDLIWF